jgi:hypothetical protein
MPMLGVHNSPGADCREILAMLQSLFTAAQPERCAASFGRVDSSLNRICQSSESNDLKVIVKGVV